MDSYYANQASSLPHFYCHFMQSGYGFGALASGMGRVALPLARKFVLTAATRIRIELLLQSVPDLMDVIGKKKSPKPALKSTISNSVKKQTGGSLALRMRGKRRMRRKSKRLRTGSKKTTQNHNFRKKSTQKKSVGLLRQSKR